MSDSAAKSDHSVPEITEEWIWDSHETGYTGAYSDQRTSSEYAYVYPPPLPNHTPQFFEGTETLNGPMWHPHMTYGYEDGYPTTGSLSMPTRAADAMSGDKIVVPLPSLSDFATSNGYNNTPLAADVQEFQTTDTDASWPNVQSGPVMDVYGFDDLGNDAVQNLAHWDGSSWQEDFGFDSPQWSTPFSDAHPDAHLSGLTPFAPVSASVPMVKPDASVAYIGDDVYEPLIQEPYSHSFSQPTLDQEDETTQTGSLSTPEQTPMVSPLQIVRRAADLERRRLERAKTSRNVYKSGKFTTSCGTCRLVYKQRCQPHSADVTSKMGTRSEAGGPCQRCVLQKLPCFPDSEMTRAQYNRRQNEGSRTGMDILREEYVSQLKIYNASASTSTSILLRA